MTRLSSRTVAIVLTLACLPALAACEGGPTTPAASSASSTSTPGGNSGSTTTPPPTTTTPNPVYVVLFTHIEDNTPVGVLGSNEARIAYLGWRSDLIATAQLARRLGVAWTLQPDWKFLEAALLYEDAAAMASTGGVNLFQYLRDSLGVFIDPHSHENGGYNYTDVAYLLERLGVGGSTIIGGHIWDPTLPQFAEWDRFRSAVRGEKYPQALWRGDTLMGSGTPNHTNDPVVSGVWRPRDRWDYFTDDPTGNVMAIGSFLKTVEGVSTLYDLGRAGTIDRSCMLTTAYHIRPADIQTSTTLAAVERDVLTPLSSLRSQGRVVLTDFTSLIGTWRSEYGSKGCTYRQ